MSPGSVTERVAFFAAEYTPDDHVSAGGGVAQEGEHIEVLELDLTDAIERVHTGEINDGKTLTRDQSKLSTAGDEALAPCIINSDASRYANRHAVSTSSVTWSPRTERNAYMVTSSISS